VRSADIALVSDHRLGGEPTKLANAVLRALRGIVIFFAQKPQRKPIEAARIDGRAMQRPPFDVVLVWKDQEIEGKLVISEGALRLQREYESLFQAHGIDGEGAMVFWKRLTRLKVAEFFADLAACLIGIEACVTAHHWARTLRELGHAVKLMAPL
jgi:hypothetical protein